MTTCDENIHYDNLLQSAIKIIVENKSLLLPKECWNYYIRQRYNSKRHYFRFFRKECDMLIYFTKKSIDERELVDFEFLIPKMSDTLKFKNEGEVLLAAYEIEPKFVLEKLKGHPCIKKVIRKSLSRLPDKKDLEKI